MKKILRKTVLVIAIYIGVAGITIAMSNRVENLESRDRRDNADQSVALFQSWYFNLLTFSVIILYYNETEREWINDNKYY